MAHAAYYDEPYEPRLVCIDRMTDPTSSAPRALKILQELEIADVCEVIEGDLRGSSGRVREAVGLLGPAATGRLRRCADPECRMLYLDTSRAGSRRWCSMQRCGNRSKVRAHWRRSAERADSAEG